MGRKRPGKGGRRGAGGRAPHGGRDRGGASLRDQHRSDAAYNRVGAGVPGPSRLLLTRLMREGAIWDVYVATNPRGGAPNLTQLEFEGAGAEGEKLRYTRPVEGPLLDALHSGAPVSRARLEEELDLALGPAVAVDRGGS